MKYQTLTKKIVKQLRLPKPNSHKRDNGRLLIIAGSKKYFGALVYAVKAASRLADLIYLTTTADNQKLIKKLKIKTAEFMPVDSLVFPSPLAGEGVCQRRRGEGVKILSDIDAILIGPGLDVSKATKRLVSQVIKSNKKAVLDADALNVLDGKLKRLLSPRHILTPHHGEFKRLFKKPGNQNSAARMAKQYHCHIVLKGRVDVIARADGKIYLNKTGNAGMTKGGTGDVLAGLIAGLYANNDASTAAAAGCFINGAAGDELYKKVGTFYNAEDLVNQVPITMQRLVNSK